MTNQPIDVYSIYKPWYYKYEQNNMQQRSSLSEMSRCRQTLILSFIVLSLLERNNFSEFSQEAAKFQRISTKFFRQTSARSNGSALNWIQLHFKDSVPSRLSRSLMKSARCPNRNGSSTFHLQFSFFPSREHLFMDNVRSFLSLRSS